MDSHNKQRLSNRTGVRMLVIRAVNTHKKDVIDSCNSPVTYKQLVNLHLKIYEKNIIYNHFLSNCLQNNVFQV